MALTARCSVTFALKSELRAADGDRIEAPGASGDGWSEALNRHRRDARRRGLTAGTIEKRMSVLARCERSIGVDLIDASTDQLERWLDTHSIQARTLYSYISHLAAFYRWAQLDELTERDPTVKLIRPKVRTGLPRPIATDDLHLLIAQAPTTEVAAMIYIAGHAGLRCMEIAALDGPEVMYHRDPPVVFVTAGKGGKQRVVPIGQTLVAVLQLHGIPISGPVFRKPNGDRYQPWGISHILRSHMHACGVVASAHQLRHAYATEVYRQSGGDLRMTQELLGHSSPTTTSIYTAWSQVRAAEVVQTLFS